jgi:dolichol kinase
MGSLAFFISSVAVTLILFYFLSTKNLNDVLPVTLLIAATSSVTEVLSVKGIDNITIPASVVLILTLFR